MEQVRKNTGSTLVQTQGLTQVARRWGWPDDRIHVIDDDLGLSGRSSLLREGLRRAIEAIDRGVVGAVFTLDPSRISRDPLDAEFFLTKAIKKGVLICANGRVYVTATKDLAELFGLRIQNLIAWWDNEARTARFIVARRAKSLQGHAVSRPPIGYVHIGGGQWKLDPDVAIQTAVRRVFTLYRELGSIHKVIKHHRQHELNFPRRAHGEVRWEPIIAIHVFAILTNPNYTDAYVYSRYKVQEAGDGRTRTYRLLPRDEWLIYRAHHEPYITWSEWEELQSLLASRQVRRRPPVGASSALLQGILWCRRCNRWVRTVCE